MQEATLINRVAQSALITLNLEELRPQGERVLLDIREVLFQGLILREKDFREWARAHDWAQYQDKHVAIVCTADAIVPSWAYMLLATLLAPHASYYTFGDLAQLETELYRQALAQHNWNAYAGEKVVLKGCGAVPVSIYVEATRQLTPVVDKLMYGEPCSMVPLYKRAK